MDPSQFNGPGLQAAPGILQWLARMMGAKSSMGQQTQQPETSRQPLPGPAMPPDRPGMQMESLGTPATQSPPTRSGIGVLPPMPEEPYDPLSSIGQQPAFQPQPSYFEDLSLNALPVERGKGFVPMSGDPAAPKPRQKPARPKARTFKVVDDRPKAKPAAKKKWTAKDAYNARMAERGSSMRVK